jgi:S1-C subfamily serine protease
MPRRSLVAAAAALALAALACRAAAGDDSIPVPPGAGDDLRRTAVVKAVEAVSPAVVNIAAEQVHNQAVFGFPTMEEMWSGRRKVLGYRTYKTQSLGSGVVIDPRGFVLTNSHVAAQGTSIHVKFRPADGVENPQDPGLEAKVVANDPGADLALLKIQTGGPFPFVEMGSSHDLLIGEPAIAIGNPFGFSSTVTAGVISAVNRTVNLEDKQLEGMIQTDASIDPGSSGGPLLNIHGRLIGLNSAVYREARSIGFAIPVDRVKAALSDLVDPVKSNKVWTGFEVENRGPDFVVDSVVPGGPAAEAGLRVGDVVIEVGGGTPKSVLGFKTALLQANPGEKIPLLVRRGAGEATIVAVQAAEHPALRLLRTRLGVEVEPFQVPEVEGMRFRVREVLRGSAADRIEMRPGDVVFALAGSPLGNANAVESVLRDVPKEQVVPISVLRETRRGWMKMDSDVSLD